MLPHNVRYYGKTEPLPEQVALRAGPMSLVYENGDLRYIRLGHPEIVRRIYVAVRDRNWGTVLPELSNIQIASTDDAFTITYAANHQQGDLHFIWRGTIAGDATGTISFTMDGQAQSTFLRNRIGFCVLHPHECAGMNCRIEHIDGTTEQSVFSLYIAPQLIVDGIIQPAHPFSEMRALAHEVTPGVWAQVHFDGETFETEDQRNWIDGSYKTYGTPLRLPFPVEIPAGTSIRQSVTLTLRDDRPSGIAHSGRPATGKRVEQRVSFVVGQPSAVSGSSLAAGRPPRIGLCIASHGQPLSQGELARLRALRLAHLRVDLRLSDSDYVAALRRATAEAAALDTSLEVALFLSDAADAELAALTAALGKIQPKLSAWLIFHIAEKSTTERWVRLARQHLAAYDTTVPIGGGTNVYFTELNRARPPAEALDLVCYSINPQVHAFDNASLTETCAAIATTVQSARQFAGGRPIAVTPVTLKPRFNPNATGPEPQPGPGELPPQVDVRQMSLLGAGWTLGSFKYLAESGATSVTYYETTGWRGVMETAAGSPLPEVFRSLPGAVFPLYHVLADVGDFARGEVVAAKSSHTLRVDGMALRMDARTRVLLANLSAEPQQISLRGLGARAQVRMLDETNTEQAMRSPETFRAQPGDELATDAGLLDLTLRPYAIVRIDTD
jgi:D-apionolactonase